MSSRAHVFRKGSVEIRFDPATMEFEEMEGGGAVRTHRLRAHEVWEDRLPAGISKLFVVLGEGCNMACSYCYGAHGANRDRKLDPAYIVRAIDHLASQAPGVFDLSAVGGEPLLEWDTYRKVVDYARNRCHELGLRFETGIITNGLLLSADKVDFLVSVGARILISLDGGRIRHDTHRRLQDGRESFSVITTNLPYLIASGAKTEALAILARGETDVDKVVEELADLGFLHIGVNLVSTRDPSAQYGIGDLSSLDEGYGRLVDWLLKHDVVFESFRTNMSMLKAGVDRMYNCNAGIDGVTISSEGRYSVCPVLCEFAEADLGSIDSGLDMERLDKFRDAILRDRQPGCGKCWAAPVCGGGCVSRKHAFTDNFSVPARIECMHTRMRLEWALVHHVRQGGCTCPSGYR